MAACGQLGRPDEEAAWKPEPPRTKPPPHMREGAAAPAADLAAAAAPA
jgi:hypothetical protein